MPEWFGWLNTNWFAIVGPVLIFAAFWVGGLWLRRIYYDAFRRWARRIEWKGRWLVIESTHGPFLQWAILLGFHIAIQTSRVPPDSTVVIAKLTTSLFIFSLIWMLMRIGEGMLRLYLPHIRRYIARTRAPQPPAPLMFHGMRVFLVALGVLALLNVWDAPDASGVLILAAIVVVLAFVIRDALISMPGRIRMSHASRNRSLRIGKFVLILLAIASFVELTRRGYLVFARDESANLDVMVLLLVSGLLILLASTLRSRRFRRIKPSFKAVAIPVVAVALVIAFAGIEPLASYKDTTVSVLGQGWHFVTSTTRGNVETAVARAEPGVVRVETERSGGSGMIVDKSGYILTCNHVVGDSRAVTIVLMSGEQYGGSVIGRDAATDIAIIRITGTTYGLPVIILGDSDKVRPGEDVVAIGYSLGLEGSATISRGVVSAFRTSGGVDYVQTDAAINPGNSGGPLINLRGEAIGIANFKLVHETVEGMGFAIAINEAKPFVVGAIAEDRAQQEAELEKQNLLALEREILRLVNVEREQRGIPPVAWNQGLHSGARTHSQNMQARGYLYHDTGGMFAECCYGASHVSSIHATAHATVQAWMSSTTGHREILLDPRYSAAAVGVARDQGFWATYRCY